MVFGNPDPYSSNLLIAFRHTKKIKSNTIRHYMLHVSIVLDRLEALKYII